MVKISHYYPPAGGTNCSLFYYGDCISMMANGEDWRNYIDTNDTIACPRELEFGTRIMLDNNIYTCRDRGGAIVITENGEYWIDILGKEVPYSYGEVKEAEIIL